MTSPPDDRFASLLARLPERGAVVVVAVAPGDEAGVAAERAVGIAQALAESRPHVLLAGIGGCGVVLDGVRGASGPGLEAVFTGESTLAGVAVPSAGRGPVYLPSGIPEAGRAPDREGAARRAGRLVAGLRRSGATLVLLVESDVATAAGLDASADARVPAVGTEVASDGGGRPVPAGGSKAELEPEAGTATAAPSGVAAREGTPRKLGRWRGRRDRGRTGVARAVMAVALVAVAVAGWWITMAVFGPGKPATPESAPPAAGSPATTPGSDSASGSRSGSGAAAAGKVATPSPVARSGPGSRPKAAAARRDEREGKGAPAREARPDRTRATAARDAAVVSDAPALPYSVLIASYSTRADAVRRARRWSADDDMLYLVAPTPVQGRLYYRLFAGATSSRREATGLMDRLVQRGRKEQSRAWDVRPVSLAFRLGLRPSRRSATARADSLASRGLPAYVLPAASAGDTVWQVYAGAFESRDAAAALGRALQEAGEKGELVTRRGMTGR